MAAFLSSVRAANGDRPILMILDNNPTHHARMVRDIADELDMRLVYLPPYSPDLNPIEFIWESLKRAVSKLFFINREFLISELESRSNQEASKLMFSEHWRSIFYQVLL
ncbi:MAG: transposase [Candidatus Methanomethylophilaceae archaeon]|nr:transposase [Candidatus Methanomethylophilaceae archaeon]MBR6213045.1 transposase [Candidatus Methanomethylophilaceae archaeon]